MIDEFITMLRKQIKLCKEEYWFPDDTSKREGYLEALEDIIGMLEDSE